MQNADILSLHTRLYHNDIFVHVAVSLCRGILSRYIYSRRFIRRAHESSENKMYIREYGVTKKKQLYLYTVVPIRLRVYIYILHLKYASCDVRIYYFYDIYKRIEYE